MSTEAAPLSDVERIKTESRFLRGTLVESLAERATGAIAEDDTQISKFHGIYQQDDRDLRAERRKQKLEPAFSFMIRARMPAGICTPEQWLEMDRLARTHANQTLRITTRQAFQWHGVIKKNLKPTIRAINDALLSTLAACGDVNRNVIAPPVSELAEIRGRIAADATRLADHLSPRTRAYHEIWLDGNKVETAEQESEPIYGPTYLPRKFKISFVIPPLNDGDVYAQDLGFIAIVEEGELIGYDVTIGGGMGMAHGAPETYPRLADTAGFITREQMIPVAEAVVTTQRDFGDRTERKHARLKYTIDDMGLDKFVAEVEQRSGVKFAPAHDVRFSHRGDPDGWLQDDRGAWHYTLFVENGRLADRSDRRQLSGMRAIAQVHDGEFRLTANQNVVIGDVAETAKARIEALLDEYGMTGSVSKLRRNALACVGLSTCGLAMAESERYLPGLIDRLDDLLAENGLDDDPIVIRMTGCPNGCARPYVAEIGLVGKAEGSYNLFLGGGFDGRRLNRLYAENLNDQGIVDALAPLFADYAKRRRPDEHFGDFVIRAGHVAAVSAGPEVHGSR